MNGVLEANMMVSSISFSFTQLTKIFQPLPWMDLDFQAIPPDPNLS
jgi:hypothetical protein